MTTQNPTGEKRKIGIYNILRQFHKNKLFSIMNTKGITDWEYETLQTLSGVLYLAESIFCEEDKLNISGDCECKKPRHILLSYCAICKKPYKLENAPTLMELTKDGE